MAGTFRETDFPAKATATCRLGHALRLLHHYIAVLALQHRASANLLKTVLEQSSSENRKPRWPTPLWCLLEDLSPAGELMLCLSRKGGCPFEKCGKCSRKEQKHKTHRTRVSTSYVFLWQLLLNLIRGAKQHIPQLGTAWVYSTCWCTVVQEFTFGFLAVFWYLPR